VPFNDIYEALVAGFDTYLPNIFTGGLVTGEEIPGEQLPYVVMDPLTDTSRAYTNQSKYRDQHVTLTFYDKAFDDVKNHAHRFIGLPGVYNTTPAELWHLPLGYGRILLLTPGAIHYLREDRFWKAVVQVETIYGRARA
jgi:hypothetical protein